MRGKLNCQHKSLFMHSTRTQLQLDLQCKHAGEWRMDFELTGSPPTIQLYSKELTTKLHSKQYNCLLVARPLGKRRDDRPHDPSQLNYMCNAHVNVCTELFDCVLNAQAGCCCPMMIIIIIITTKTSHYRMDLCPPPLSLHWPKHRYQRLHFSALTYMCDQIKCLPYAHIPINVLANLLSFN